MRDSHAAPSRGRLLPPAGGGLYDWLRGCGVKARHRALELIERGDQIVGVAGEVLAEGRSSDTSSAEARVCRIVSGQR